MNIRRAIGIGFLVGLAILGTTASELKCSGSSGGTSQHQGPKNDDKYREWCKHVVEGDRSTYVYYYSNQKGDSGYVKGRSNIERYIHDPNYSTKRIC